MQNQAGYNDQDCFLRIARQFIARAPFLRSEDSEPLYLFIDGHHSHKSPEALAELLAANIHVFFLRAGNSDNDQPNDNGPNSALKSLYAKHHDRFFSGVDSSFTRVQAMSPPVFNQIFLSAWQDLILKGDVIKRAFEKTGLHPLNSNAVNYDETATCLSSLFTGVVQAGAVHDPSDAAGLAEVSSLPPLNVTECSTQLVLSSPEASSKQVVIRKAVLDLVCAPLAFNAAQINKVNQNFKRARNNTVSTGDLSTESGLQVTGALIEKLKQNQEKKNQEADAKKARDEERGAKIEAKVRERAAAWEKFQVFKTEADLHSALHRAKVDDVRLVLEHLTTNKDERSNIRKMKKPEAMQAMIDVFRRGVVPPTAAPAPSQAESVIQEEEHVDEHSDDGESHSDMLMYAAEAEMNGSM